MSPRPPAGPLRAAVERRSAVLLVVLSRQPRWLLPLVTVLLLLGVVLLAAPLAAVCLVALLGLLGWLSYLSWPAADGRGRAVRLTSLAVLLLVGVQSLL